MRSSFIWHPRGSIRDVFGLVNLAAGLAATLTLLAPAVGAAACSAEPASQQDRIAAIDARLEDFTAAGRFSGSVLIARGDDVLYRKGFGYADREAGVANSARTQFNICSMGKTITAAAMMLLVEEGLVDLHVPISTYLRDFPGEMAEQITVHNLLSHTAGLGNYMAQREFGRNMTDMTTIDQLYELVKQEELQFAPGTRFSYSNSGFIVAGKIIEVVSGQSYFDFVRERILEPLGMDRTEFYTVSARPEDVAFGYTREDGQLVREVNRAPNPASDGGVHSTVDDLFAFDRALHAATLTSVSSRDLMFTPNLNGYGYGLSIKPPEEHASGRTSIGHTGGLRDRSTVLRHFIDDDTVIIVLSNYPAVAYEVAREIEAVIY
jgi:CubicO group peptidase (beta-lactamase class C family)